MRFCDKHWAALRKAIDDRGLAHLVSKDGRAAVARLKSEADGTAEPRTYDPLLAAHNMIIGAALKDGGLYVLGEGICPVCEAMSHAPHGIPAEEMERDWIDGPADEVLDYCRDNGLAPAEAEQ